MWGMGISRSPSIDSNRSIGRRYSFPEIVIRRFDGNRSVLQTEANEDLFAER